MCPSFTVRFRGMLYKLVRKTISRLCIHSYVNEVIQNKTYIIDECYEMFNLKRIFQLIVERYGKFLRNLCNVNVLCALLAEFAVKELFIYNL